ncbi:hypothetical protein ACHAPA_009965 [Fusarium lateritium]
MARFQTIPTELFDYIHKYCDPTSRLNLLLVCRQFYCRFIQSHLKHVRVSGSQSEVSQILATLLDEDKDGFIKKNRASIQTASIEFPIPRIKTSNYKFKYPNGDRWKRLAKDEIISHIVRLIEQAKGLKYLDLRMYLLTDAQKRKFRLMLWETGKWMIQTLSIKGSVKTTLACLQQCDPMQLTGVDFLSAEQPRTRFPKSGIVDETRFLTGEYKALKAFYNMPENRSHPLKRLSIRYSWERLKGRVFMSAKETFHKVAFITKDFPNLEWLILEEHITLKRAFLKDHEFQAWEGLLEGFIANLRETKLVKLAFFLCPELVCYLLKRSSNAAEKPNNARIDECYLSLAQRLVESVPGLKDVAITKDTMNSYRATQSGNEEIETEHVIGSSNQNYYMFPRGLLDTWA